jgi:hypothetical protein
VDSPSRLGLLPTAERTARVLAAASRGALDRPLRHPAELCVSIAADEALLVGAFQRGASVPESGVARPWLRRGSGGPEVILAAGSIHVALALAHPGALVPCDEKRIVNRAVRPLLRALTRTGSTAHYFGRDWVSVRHRPAAWVGFAHDASTRRTVFEAVVAVGAPFAALQRPSFLGKAHGSLESIGGRPVDPVRVAEAIVEAYSRDTGAVVEEAPEAAVTLAEDDSFEDPPWAFTVEEAIGVVGAGPDARGVLRVGGDLLVSRDALARLEARAAAAPDGPDDLAHVVDETLAAPGVALDGVRSLGSLLEVVSRAARARAASSSAASGRGPRPQG